MFKTPTTRVGVLHRKVYIYFIKLKPFNEKEKKEMRKLKEMKKNNKGFSLVELIVVIAIMVVLVAVLGSTILGYVEKSKYSKDVQALDSLKTAVSTYVADPSSNYEDGEDYTLTTLMATDTKGIMQGILQEVFTFAEGETGADGSKGDATGTFNGKSKAFSGVTAGDVKIVINKGAVQITVHSKDDEFDNYVVGTEIEEETTTK